MLSKKNNAQRYTSRIEEIMQNHMIIAMPMEKGYPIFHGRGNVFYGRVFDESGGYSFKSTYIDRKMSHLPIWIVTLPVDIKKSQQRSFVRFDVTLPVVVEYSLDDESDEIVALNLITKDLSGGGLQVICNQKIKLGKKVQLTIDFPDYGALKVDGEVVRLSQPQIERQLFWIGIKFSGIHESIRDKISRFIFRKQLEQRQKGL